jgi:hypothetical protein
VGIGTTTPISTLSLKGTAGTNPLTIASSTGASLFTVLQNGNVGIGQASPTYSLEVGNGGTPPAGNASTLRLNDNSDNQSITFSNASSNRFTIGQNATVLKFSSQDTAAGGIGQSFSFIGGTPDISHQSSLFKVTGNFNNAGQTIDGLLLNITNSSSSATSTLANFQVGGASKFLVDISGKVGIGTTTPANKLYVYDSASNNVAKFEGISGAQCTVVAGTGWSCTSDERLKTNITDYNDADMLSKVTSLRTVNYNWKNGDGYKQYGVLAQNVETIFPTIVMTDAAGTKSVRYGEFTPILISAVKELNRRLDALASTTLALSASTTMGMYGNVNADVDMKGFAITNIKSLSSASGKWSIDENGNIIARTIQVDGVELRDSDGSTYCYKSEGGVLTKVGLAPCPANINTGSNAGIVAGTSTQNTNGTSTNGTSTASSTASGNTNGSSTQTVTCNSPQILDTNTNTCVDPVTCMAPLVLDATLNTCIDPTAPAPVNCTAPQVLNTTTNTCVDPSAP